MSGLPASLKFDARKLKILPGSLVNKFQQEIPGDRSNDRSSYAHKPVRSQLHSQLAEHLNIHL